MSRSGYGDDCDEGSLGLYRGAVQRAIDGKRGQAMLRDLLVALDAMPVKALAVESLVTAEGEFCTLGVLGHARGLMMPPVDPEDFDNEAVARLFGVAPSLIREIVYENDEGDLFCIGVGPAQRWERMRGWVAAQLTAPAGVTL